jgi:hypothetical protein
MRREGRIERGLKILKDVWLHKIVQTGHVALSEAGLMIGKTMTSLRTCPECGGETSPETP